MIKNQEVRITFGNQSFTGIRELGFDSRGTFVVSLWTTPVVTTPSKIVQRGSYFTTIPISPLEHRRQKPTQAAIQDGNTQVVVFDDWGRPHPIIAPRPILLQILADAKKYELPQYNAQMPRPKGK